MEQKMTAHKAIAALALGNVSAGVATPFLPDGAPWWAYLIIWALPQVLGAVVYFVPNRPV